MTSPTDEPLAVPEDKTIASPEVKRYQRQKLTTGIASLVVSLAVLSILAFGFGPALESWSRAALGDNDWLRLVVLAAVYAVVLELTVLPLDFYSGFLLEHRYHLSNQSLVAWLWKKVKSYLVGGALGLPMLLGLYALLWLSGPWWWLWATVGWLGVTLLLGRLLPVVILPLFYKVTRLEDSALADRLRRLAEGTGVAIEGVYRLHLSAETRKANAALAGLGKTRRVLLGDTLLEQFTPEEIEVVFAHEIGHHVYRHIFKMVAWNVLVVSAGFWLADVVLRPAAVGVGYSSFSEPAALPLLFLVLGVFGLLMSPAQNALSRFFETQSDRYALRRTNRPDAFRSAFTKLATINKADPNPHPVIVWLFEDHPPIGQRLALADGPLTQ